MKDFSQTIFATEEVRELFGMFSSHGVRYLISGGCAVMWYSGARYTRNIDIWMDRNAANARRLFAILRAYGAPLACLTADDFAQPGSFYQMGRPPLRIDDMANPRGISFEEAWQERESVSFGGVRFFFLSRRHLIEAKLAAGRPQDMVDARQLIDGFFSTKRLL